MSLEEEVIEVDPEVAEYCEELCYDIQKEHEGLCDGDDCIDDECYANCVKSFYEGGGT